MEGVKIADVRSIQKVLGIKRSQKEALLIVLSGTITSEAQNALLKTLEESSEMIFILILTQNASEFLPTVQSRCLLVKLKNIEEKNIILLPSFVHLASNPTYLSIVKAIDSLAESPTSTEYDEFIVQVRALLLTGITSTDLSYEKLIRLLHILLEYTPLVKKNNIQVRPTIEQACIAALL